MLHRIRAVRLLAALWMAAAALPSRADEGSQPESLPAPPGLEAFEREMRGWMDRFDVPRASLAVLRGDHLMLALGHGGRAALQRVPIWSLSKAITATCIATLVREGAIGLDDPVGRLLAPPFPHSLDSADPLLARATIAQLLTHRGGWSRRAHEGFERALADLLRRVPPGDASVEALFPAILRLPLTHEPGATYEYSNLGYLVLGQIIEARTGEAYAEACARRVLARAGVRSPVLDATWGGIWHSAGGWSLSPPEYLAFLRLLQPRDPDLLSPELRAWLGDGTGKWIDERVGLAYTLGMLLRLPQRNLFHTGGFSWRQRDAARGRIAVKEGTWAVLAADGTAWMASFEGLSPVEDEAAVRALDDALWRARGTVARWPEADLFAEAGIGPVAVGE